MSFTSNDNTYAPVGINKDNLVVLDTSTSTDNISLHSSNNDSIDIINIKTLLNKDSNKELHLSAFDGSTINPIIKINNTHQHVNITSNLGIGTQNPQSKLDVNGTLNVSGATTLNNILTVANDTATNGSPSLSIIAGTSDSHQPVLEWKQNDEQKGYARYLPNENIFEIRSTRNEDSFRIGPRNSSGGTDGTIVIDTDNINLHQDTYISGNVGINTSTPNIPLHIYKYVTDASSTNNTLITLETTTSNDANSTAFDFNPISIDFRMTNQGNQQENIARISAVIAPQGSNVSLTDTGDGPAEGSNALIFSTTDGAVSSAGDPPTERMRIGHDGNVGIGTQNPQSKLDVNGDIQFKSNNEFNNISDFFPGYYKSINSGTNIGLPTDYGPTGTVNLEELKIIRYNNMKISMIGKTIYTNIAIYDQARGGHSVWSNLNGVNKNGYYFQLTGTGIQGWNSSSGTYENTDGTLTNAWDRAHSDHGSIYIDLEDKNQNSMAIYRNKFTEISFDVCFTAFNGTTGDALSVHITPTDGVGGDLFNVVMKSYTHYQFVNYYHKEQGSYGDWKLLVSFNKLVYNNRNENGTGADGSVGSQTAANNLKGTFFNIKVVFNDDEWALYFDNKILKTDLTEVHKGGGQYATSPVSVGTEIKRTLSSDFKNYVNNAYYSRLKITYACGASYARCHVKNIQIKSGFGCHMNT